MRKTILGLSGAAAALVVLAGGTTAAGAPAIPMSGAQEAAAADNNGHGSFTYDISGTAFCYTLTYQGIESPTAAHVHLGDRHVAGDVVIPLDPGGRLRHPDVHHDHPGAGGRHHRRPQGLLRQRAQRDVSRRGHPRTAQGLGHQNTRAWGCERVRPALVQR